MSIHSSLPSSIVRIIQDNYLQRKFLDALRPKTLFRREAVREQLQLEAGQSMTMTRAGLIQPSIDVIAPTEDPGLVDYSIEQWTVTMNDHGKSIETHLPSSGIAIVNKFVQDAVKLAEHAGWSMDRKTRAELFTPYNGGFTFATGATSSSTTLPVAAISGFRFKHDADGKPQAVSASNALSIVTGSGAGTANTVVGATPYDPKFPDGPGELTLGSAISATARMLVRALNRPYMALPSGCASIDDITSSKPMTVDQFLNARTRLVKDRVPRFADGTYHMHIDPDHLKQLLTDQWVRDLFRGVPNAEEMKQGVLIRQWGITFFENDDLPANGNLSTGLKAAGNSAQASPEIAGDIYNSAGVEIRRSIMLGDRALSELYVPQERFQGQVAGVPGALLGYQGVFREGGLDATMDGIQYIVRPPIDPRMTKIMQTYALTAGWVAPSDIRSTTSDAVFKRAVVLPACGAT